MFTHASFVIIDQCYVVWPILTYIPGGEGLKRHGAMIFTDPRGQFVQHLMTIFDTIDTNAQRLEIYHLGLRNEDL